MDICLGYLSALQYWRHHPADHAHRIIAPGQLPVLHAADIQVPAGFDPMRLGLTPPFHLCVQAGTQRKAPLNAIVHKSGLKFPDESFVRAGAGVVVATPELCFLQLANRVLTLPHLVLLGYELCGGYVLRPDMAKGHMRCKPLTSAERLSAYIERVPNHPGVKLARRAAAYLANGSLSPTESLLATPLALSTAAGGYGFDAPALNRRIDIPLAAQREAGRTHFKCDLFWPKHNVGIEYNGKWHYDAREQRDSDVVRENILADLGVNILVVTAEQLYNAELFDSVAQRLAHRMGRRLRVRAAGFDEKRRRLHAELMGPNPTL